MRYRVPALALAASRRRSSPRSSVGGAGAGHQAVSGKISMIGIWTATEQKSFQAVIAGFHKKFPGVTVSYTSGREQHADGLATALAGGKPPDVAAVGQPALVRAVREAGPAEADHVRAGRDHRANYGPTGITLGTVNGKLYGLFFKAANKSTVWYNVKAFKNAGVKPPKTWPQLLSAAKTLRGSGVPAYAIGGAEGWTLTDLFENIYLRTAGPAKYDLLTDHKIKWTDASVKKALTLMGADPRRHAEHPGRHVGCAPDRLPAVGRPGLHASRRRRRW